MIRFYRDATPASLVIGHIAWFWLFQACFLSARAFPDSHALPPHRPRIAPHRHPSLSLPKLRRLSSRPATMTTASPGATPSQAYTKNRANFRTQAWDRVPVPWINDAEWLYVHDLLFRDAHDVAARQHALRRLKVWASRTKLPHALRATAEFLEIDLIDGCGGWLPSTLSDSALRQLYAFAIVRLVNGFTDLLQRGQFAMSVRRLAATIAMPLVFVEIRHEATHGDLPPLAALREVARDALLWLKTRYWDARTARIHGYARLEQLMQHWQQACATELQVAGKHWSHRCCHGIAARLSPQRVPFFVQSALLSCDRTVLDAARSPTTPTSAAVPALAATVSTSVTAAATASTSTSATAAASTSVMSTVTTTGARASRHDAGWPRPPNEAVWSPVLDATTTTQQWHVLAEVMAQLQQAARAPRPSDGRVLLAWAQALLQRLIDQHVAGPRRADGLTARDRKARLRRLGMALLRHRLPDGYRLLHQLLAAQILDAQTAPLVHFQKSQQRAIQIATATKAVETEAWWPSLFGLPEGPPASDAADPTTAPATRDAAAVGPSASAVPADPLRHLVLDAEVFDHLPTALQHGLIALP
ncbi:hypothetical protein CXG81DRAFT_17866 [Caulochytrium protostelioides]|uniref:Las1-domain-containing protein n=1 Tax=Caulochytrium protostelioides TaxID=1555241 RepID=A0A4P9XAX6_9FUNG|nr:hypothetical protein CXG81DRAFT_17866 [Caulochytrium protostelioides]|eukprot:RKP02506.1 hypothetical protein CXG81DRAFT_17866 [Caulochytrium protostelioides]